MIQSSNTPIIKISNLSKSFGSFKALDNLSMDICRGEIFGLIGPNGSGKTTTINLLLGLLTADAGSSIEIMGYKIPDQVKWVYPAIGYMPQDLSLYMDLSVRQNLAFFGKIQGIPKKRLQARIPEVLKLVDLAEFADRVVSKCSGGMQRRASLAVALLHEPKILLLDEPTVGVDPELRIIFWKYFRRLASEQGVTILITTHYLAESVNCDRVGFINKRIIAEGSPRALQQHVQQATGATELPDMERVFVHFTHEVRGGAITI